MLVILDGPEKAGKSTLARALVKGWTRAYPTTASIRKWGVINGEDRLYLYGLQEDVPKVDQLVIWDRSYASEAVYCKLLKRDGRLRDDPFYGEWAYGRISQAVGRRYMILGPSAEVLKRLRDDSDHKCCPSAERQMFFRYAQTYGWCPFVNAHNDVTLNKLVETILDDVSGVQASLSRYNNLPPHYVGPQSPRVLILGEPKKNRRPRHLDSWAPFGTRLTSQLGYDLGLPALRYGWSNITWCSINFIRSVPTVVACGSHVQRWLRDNAFTVTEYDQRVIPTYHPAWLYRFGDGLDKSETTILNLKGRLLTCQRTNRASM